MHNDVDLKGGRPSRRGWLWAGALFAVVANVPVFAAAIGEPEHTARLGGGPVLSYFAADDSQGAVAKEANLHVTNFVFNDHFKGSYRYWLNVFYNKTAFEADADHLGMDAARFGAHVSFQRRLSWEWPLKLWLGAGAQLSRVEYTKRHRVDGSGFLVQRFDDRSEFELGVVFDATSEWQLAPRWDIVGRSWLALPLGDGVTEWAASAVFLYRY